MSRQTLRAELTRASLLTTLVALLLSAASLLAYELTTYRDALVADLRTQADLLAHSTAAALSFNDPKAAHENIALLRLKPTIQVGAIYQLDGRPFATYASDKAQAPPPPVLLPTRGQRVHFRGSEFEVSYPITDNGDVVGTIYLRARHDIWPRTTSYVAILAAVTLASLALSYVVFGRLQRKVTTPLLAMASVAKEVMSRRDWSLRAPASANLDVGLLVQAFNDMLAEVETSTGELERSNAQLERETAERRLAEENLRTADRRKDEFLATLAHELRNPLAPMTNAVALVRSPQAPLSVREKAAVILERQLRHMVRLIDDLLDVSRITTGKLSLRTEALDLKPVLRTAVELAEPLAKERRQTLTLDLPEEPCWLVADGARLTQVFSNLLSNACRYTPHGGRIEVAMRPDDGWVEVEVRDTGIGIAPEMQQRIFELFEQADKTLERGNVGLGIGLTLARQLTRLHGGDISVSSEGLGKGSCFTVRLPVHGMTPALSPLPDDAFVAGAGAGAASAHPLSVLVADDNRDYASSLGDLLHASGHDVVVVGDGHEALAAAGRRAPDVALLDIGMPGLNGYELARRLREDPATASALLVAITGWGQRADKEAAREAGFDVHLVKPVALDALMKILSDESRRRGGRASR